MTRQAERIIKELSPQFPEWNSDFRDFLQWQHYGLIGSDIDKYEMWESMENLYSTLMASMIRMSGIKDINSGIFQLFYYCVIQFFL